MRNKKLIAFYLLLFTVFAIGITAVTNAQLLPDGHPDSRSRWLTNGWIVGFGLGQSRAKINGGTKGRFDPGNNGGIGVIRAGYQFNRFVTVEATHQNATTADDGLNTSERLCCGPPQETGYKVRSKLTGVSLIGTLFPRAYVRPQVWIGHFKADQKLSITQYNAVPHTTIREGYPETRENLEAFESRSDKQSRYGWGYGLGVVGQPLSKLKITFGFTKTPKVGDAFFDDSIHLDIAHLTWNLGVTVGPF